MTLGDHLAEPLVVGEPDVVGPLAVYPIFGPTCGQQFAALSQANGDVAIGEAETASVRDLVMTNHAKVPILVYEGEEVLGGQQHRSLDVSVLVAAETTLKVPVSCVEAGRWDHARHGASFRSSPHSPSPELRKAKSKSAREGAAAGAEARADQAECWGLVDSISTRLGASSRTRALSDTYDQRRRDLRRFERGIRLRDGQLGSLVAVGRNLCVLDFVGRPDAFAALLGPLVQGYALEALAAPERTGRAPAIPAARAFVGAALGASGNGRPALGLGSDVRFTRRGVAGTALVNDSELVSLTAFPEDSDATATTGGRRQIGRIARPSGRGRRSRH